MWVCKNCGTEIDNDKLLSCFNCGYGKEGTPPADEATLAEAKSIKANPRAPRTPSRSSGNLSTSGYVRALRLFGWVALIAGVVGGLAALITSLSTHSDPKTGAGTYYFIIAIAVMFQGSFVFVMCHVVSEIAEDVLLIRSQIFNRR